MQITAAPPESRIAISRLGFGDPLRNENDLGSDNHRDRPMASHLRFVGLRDREQVAFVLCNAVFVLFIAFSQCTTTDPVTDSTA